MEIDHILLQQVEEICGGEHVHLNANLVGAYRGAVDEYNRTGEENYLHVALEAHKELRVLLAKARIRQAQFIKW